MDKLNKYKTLRIRLSDDEWKYLKDNKFKTGMSFNCIIRSALIDKMKIKLPF